MHLINTYAFRTIRNKLIQVNYANLCSQKRSFSALHNKKTQIMVCFYFQVLNRGHSFIWLILLLNHSLLTPTSLISSSLVRSCFKHLNLTRIFHDSKRTKLYNLNSKRKNSSVLHVTRLQL
jgi:hypothetical protein